MKKSFLCGEADRLANDRIDSSHMSAAEHEQETWTYLVRLVQQLHPLLEDLAVVLAALPQHLPPQLLHGRPQLVPLELVQRLAVVYHLQKKQ